jgi:3-hydroxyacyl-CoA dehydrogenase
MLVQLERSGPIAVLTLDNPPVNALNHALRQAIRENLAATLADPDVAAVVIACAGRTFIAGADISEMDKPRIEPVTATLAAMLEDSAKPTVASIHGTALGGGLEIALGCHWRVASKDARLGLPEVKLGLIPGGGGTQRLPRLIGGKRALAMITGGEMVTASEALAAGLIDEIAEGPLRDAAIAFARRLVDAKTRPRRSRDLPLREMDAALFREARGELAKRKAALDAPQRAIDAVEAAALPFDEGMAREREIFVTVQHSVQSRALRHVFFAERDAAKIAGLPDGIVHADIRSAAIIGAGTMGGGIAICFANVGIPVRLIETEQAALDRGLAAIRRIYESSAKRQNWSAAEIARRQDLITPSLALADSAAADIVVEAVFEDLALKQKIFAELDRIARPDAILASNTSYQDLDAIAAATRDPTRIVGLHFFSPAQAMRLVEVVRGEATAPAVLASAVDLARKLKKLPVVVGNSPGFAGNRMLYARSREVDRLLQEGAPPQQIDSAATAFGFAMGPCAASDLAGLDIGWRMRQARGLSFPVADALCAEGRFGQKTGAGYYRYAAGSRTPEPDAETTRVIAGVRGRDAPRGFTQAEIVERLMLPVINEAARLLEEGIAQRPGDIDTILIHGYGFPAWRGGPLFYADGLGLGTIAARLSHLARATGEPELSPAPLIERLAKEGRWFLK